ncbi:MAG TPA: MFS transporter [Phenylobacterium sp.]|uniref:MFS transporter n=1 Tax=Phenylobacterium sp. TaxID=1871053 RepID=UPI002B97F7BC|nr:MFS transporter [Phenylobacterium sp.]HXA40894.1 MFS transporter [Phenylobacterium sp.]
MSTITAGPAPAPATGLRKVILASMIGTTIEWYDFFLYGTASALVFGKLFFPKADPLTGTMLAFTTYALGFVARPLGGLVFGHFGDRIGRKQLLMLSLVLMGGSTFLIGLLPTFMQIGLFAPLGLVLLRLVQGFAVGGEWGGAVLMVCEFGDAKRRGFWAGWPQAGVPAGNLLAAAVLAVMSAAQSEHDFLAWGWRVPFLLSAVLVAVGYWVRVTLAESPLFQRAIEDAGVAKAPVLEAIRRRPGGIAIGMGLRLAENISFYLITTFSISYMTETVHLSRSFALNAMLAGAAVECCAIPVFAWLSDKIGRRPVYFVGAAGMAIWGFAFFRMIDTGLTPNVLIAVIVGLVLHGAMYGPQAAFIAELFPTRMRYSGASLAYQATSIFAGSLAPIIALALLKATHSAVPIAIYLAIAGVISAFSALRARETKGMTFAQIDAETPAT